MLRLLFVVLASGACVCVCDGRERVDSSPSPSILTSSRSTMYTTQKVVLATPAELAVPPIAWPTVGVFVLGVLLYCLPPLLTWHAPSLKVRRREDDLQTGTGERDMTHTLQKKNDASICCMCVPALYVLPFIVLIHPHTNTDPPHPGLRGVPPLHAPARCRAQVRDVIRGESEGKHCIM